MEWYKTSNRKQENISKQRTLPSASSSKSKDHSDDENQSEMSGKKRIHPSSSSQKESSDDETPRISDGTRSSTAARNASSKRNKAA